METRHTAYAEREQLVEHRLPRLLLQETGKHRHFLYGRLLLLSEAHSAARAEGVVLRDPQVNQEERRDVDRGGNERVVRRVRNNPLRVSNRKHHNGELTRVVVTEVGEVVEGQLAAASQIGQWVLALHMA